ncbi:zinc knuckle CX2CX4HX4C containing protein, partial [Tanacetum coccineum]
MQPYRNVNVVESPMVVETLDATRADDGGVVIDVVAGNMNRPNVAEPAFSIGKNGHGVTSVNKEDEGTVKTMISVVKVATLTNKEKVLGAHVVIPLATVEEISAKFDNTMYGYFIGSWLAFPIVKNYVHNAWAKYGFESVIVRDGFFMFKFSSHEGMTKVLDGGSWFIRSRPLMLNIWCANTKMKKVDCTRIPVWTKIHNVLVVAFSEVGLSLITTQLEWPLMLDACTSDTCLNPWGPKTYARVLIELSIDKAIGHLLENLDVTYEWRPLQCSNCKNFNHDDDCCPSRDTKAAPSSTLGNGGVRKPVSKATQVDGKITSFVNQEGTNEAGNKPSRVLEASSDTPLRDNDKSTYIQDDINIGQLRNNMNRLMEEDKILDINTDLGGNDVTGDKTSLIIECSTSTKSVYAKVEGQVKGSDKGSNLEQFRKSRENSLNKSISDSDESEVEEVCMPYSISGGGFLDVLEDDLDCFDGYGAQVYDLTEQEQAF